MRRRDLGELVYRFLLGVLVDAFVGAAIFIIFIPDLIKTQAVTEGSPIYYIVNLFGVLVLVIVLMFLVSFHTSDF